MTTENLMNLNLTYGTHESPEDGMCLMEAVAFMGGEEHSDHPVCACPVIAAYARNLNDQMGEGAEGDALRAKHLLPIAQKLIGTRSTPEVERKRAFYFADRAVRLFAPLVLEAAGFTEEAETLRSLPEIVGEQTARAADAAASAAEAASAASAAADAAYAASAAEAAYAAYADAAFAAFAADAWAGRAAAGAAAWAGRAAADAANVAEAAGWAQAAQVLAEACETNLEGGE